MKLIQECSFTAMLKPPLPIGAGPIGTRMYYDVRGGEVTGELDGLDPLEGHEAVPVIGCLGAVELQHGDARLGGNLMDALGRLVHEDAHAPQSFRDLCDHAGGLARQDVARRPLPEVEAQRAGARLRRGNGVFGMADSANLYANHRVVPYLMLQTAILMIPLLERNSGGRMGGGGGAESVR